MKIDEINEYPLILNELYYVHERIETLGELKNWIGYFNSNLKEPELKEATFLFFKNILSDGTHYFKSNNNADGSTYSKEKNNLKEAYQFFNDYWDDLAIKMKDKNPDTGIFLNNGKIIDVSPYLQWTDSWKKELCQLTNIGYANGWSHKCNKIPNYRYQMPNPPFIPDNDCGCEE